MSERAWLLRRAARSLAWNALLLPLVTALNLAAAVLIRRTFGLESGRYDVLIGLLNTLLFYSSLGIPVSFTQFLPQVESSGGGRRAVRAFVLRAGALRLGLAVMAVVAVNLLARPLAARLPLGEGAPALVALLSLVLLLRAATEVAVRTLQALLRHLAANLAQLLQAFALAAALAAVLARGGGMQAVLAALALAAALVAAFAWSRVVAAWRSLPERPGGDGDRFPVPWRRFWGFALFMYLFDLSTYFSGPAYAATALGAVTSAVAPVALFAVAFQIPQMIVVVVLAGFQGLYRPLFSRLVQAPDRTPLRTAYAEVSKVQAALLLPAGVGLWILLRDLIPLLFGSEFVAAVPLARVLTAALFAEALLNLGNIVLSVDRRYGAVLAAQSLRLLAAVAFPWVAGGGHLLAAAVVFGTGRVAAVAAGTVMARRRYGTALAWPFVARLVAPTLAMAAIVLVIGAALPPGWPRVVTMAVGGASAFLAAMRRLGVLGPRELDLLRRAQLPGGSRIIAWLERGRPPRRPGRGR